MCDISGSSGGYYVNNSNTVPPPQPSRRTCRTWRRCPRRPTIRRGAPPPPWPAAARCTTSSCTRVPSSLPRPPAGSRRPCRPSCRRTASMAPYSAASATPSGPGPGGGCQAKAVGAGRSRRRSSRAARTAAAESSPPLRWTPTGRVSPQPVPHRPRTAAPGTPPRARRRRRSTPAASPRAATTDRRGPPGLPSQWGSASASRKLPVTPPARAPRSRRRRRRRAGPPPLSSWQVLGRGAPRRSGTGAAATRANLSPPPVVETPAVDAAAAAEATSGVVPAGSAALALPRVIVEAGPTAVGKFVEFFAGRIANEWTRAAYARAAGQFLGWCEGRGLRLRGRRRLHSDAPRVGADREAVPGRDPHALRLARRQPDPPGEPRRGGPGAEARRHEGRDAGPLAGGGEEAPREDRHGHPGRAPGPGAALGHALQLRAGERGPRDAAAGLLRAGEPGVAQAPREAAELRPQDQVAIVVYAGAAGMVLPPTSGGREGDDVRHPVASRSGRRSSRMSIRQARRPTRRVLQRRVVLAMIKQQGDGRRGSRRTCRTGYA